VVCADDVGGVADGFGDRFGGFAADCCFPEADADDAAGFGDGF